MVVHSLTDKSTHVTKKQMNKCMADIYRVWVGFEHSMPELKANTITRELKRILPNTVVIVFYFLPNDSFSYQSKLKAFPDDNLNVKQKLKFALG